MLPLLSGQLGFPELTTVPVVPRLAHATFPKVVHGPESPLGDRPLALWAVGADFLAGVNAHSVFNCILGSR